MRTGSHITTRRNNSGSTLFYSVRKMRLFLGCFRRFLASSRLYGFKGIPLRYGFCARECANPMLANTPQPPAHTFTCLKNRFGRLLRPLLPLPLSARSALPLTGNRQNRAFERVTGRRAARILRRFSCASRRPRKHRASI